MSEKPKPIRVKAVVDDTDFIYYGGERKRNGSIFYIELPIHFSKSGKMVRVDDEGNEIRHKGGFREIKDDRGNVIRIVSMKDKPVAPGEEVMQPTAEEVAEEKRKADYERDLAALNKKYEKKPEKPVEKVQEVI